MEEVVEGDCLAVVEAEEGLAEEMEVTTGSMVAATEVAAMVVEKDMGAADTAGGLAEAESAVGLVEGDSVAGSTEGEVAVGLAGATEAGVGLAEGVSAEGSVEVKMVWSSRSLVCMMVVRRPSVCALQSYRCRTLYRR
jgi:hypothetical protein